MKISVYQKIARILVTIMTVGAMALLTVCLIAGFPIDTFRQILTNGGTTDDPYFTTTAVSILTAVSYLLELLGMAVWPILGVTRSAFAVYGVLMIFLLGNLFLSRYLTKFKGTRTAITVNLALITFDLPFVFVYTLRSEALGLTGVAIIPPIVCLVFHLSAVFFLIMALIYTYRNDAWFSDLFPSPYAYQIKSYNSEIRNGMTDKEVVSVWRRLTIPRIARVLTVLIALGTLVTWIVMLAINVTDYDGINVWITFVIIVNSILCWFFGGIGIGSDLPVQICMGLCLLIFIAALFFMQRYFTRDSRLTKPALVFTLTAAVIDTLPFLSIAGVICVVNVIIHVLWIVMLALSLRKVCKKEKKTPDPATDPETGEKRTEVPLTDTEE